MARYEIGKAAKMTHAEEMAKFSLLRRRHLGCRMI